MICPYCSKKVVIPDNVLRNLETFHNSVIVRTECCDKLIHIDSVITYECEKTEQTETGDWGN